MRTTVLSACVAALLLVLCTSPVAATSVRGLARQQLQQQPASATSSSLSVAPAVGGADLSVLCLAKCAAEIALCIHDCDHPSAEQISCKAECALKGTGCSALCVLADAEPQVPTLPTPVRAVAPVAAAAATTAVASVPLAPIVNALAPVVGDADISALCLAKCAAELAVCIHECDHPSGLGGCKEDCAGKSAICTAKCVLLEPTPPTSVRAVSAAPAAVAPATPAVIDSSNIESAFAQLTFSPLAAVAASASAAAAAEVSAPAIDGKCLAKCAMRLTLCIHECDHPSGLGGCKENCAADAAECTAECALADEAKEEQSSAVVAVPSAPAAAAAAAAVTPVTEVTVGSPSTIDYKCLAKCAVECAYCIYECNHPNGTLGGCKENCAATAAECSAECVLEESAPSAAKEVILAAEKGAALVESPEETGLVAESAQPQVGEPLTAVCLAKCAAEAAYCVYECDHPSFGLGGCKEDCAGKAAICSAQCVL